MNRCSRRSSTLRTSGHRLRPSNDSVSLPGTPRRTPEAGRSARYCKAGANASAIRATLRCPTTSASNAQANARGDRQARPRRVRRSDEAHLRGVLARQVVTSPGEPGRLGQPPAHDGRLLLPAGPCARFAAPRYRAAAVARPADAQPDGGPGHGRPRPSPPSTRAAGPASATPPTASPRWPRPITEGAGSPCASSARRCRPAGPVPGLARPRVRDRPGRPGCRSRPPRHAHLARPAALALGAPVQPGPGEYPGLTGRRLGLSPRRPGALPPLLPGADNRQPRGTLFSRVYSPARGTDDTP